MENQVTEAPKVAEPTAEEKAVAQQLGVIQVIERLFNGVNAGSYPLRATEDVMAGMQFLAQFHKQLVAQLPADVKAKIEAETEARNAPKA